MKAILTNLLKGALIGAANVIPGVSGGTMALLTGIFERLIHAIRSFDLAALKLLHKRDIKGFLYHTDFFFLCTVGMGAVVSITSLARLLELLFERHTLYIWAFFFGLILSSVYFVAAKIRHPRASVYLLFLLGAAIAASVAFMKPLAENASGPYLMLCGAIAMCSMILPGLSGSYMLLLLGNYQLVMIDAVANMRIEILIPVAIGAGVGLLLFARLLAWVFKNFHDQTTGLLSGFILGSLSILWPWKKTLTQTFSVADTVKEKVIGYRYFLPEINLETAIATALILLGAACILGIEQLAKPKQS